MTTTEIEAVICPRCSLPPHCSYKPAFHLCHRASRDKGESLGMFIGCSHFTAVQPRVIVPATRHDEIVAKWNDAAAAHFVALTSTWSTEQREAFRIRLTPAPLISLPSEYLEEPEDCPI